LIEQNWSRLYSETFAVVFGNLYSWNLYTETNTVVFGNFYSETYILQLIQLYSETNGQGVYSETYIPKLIQMCSETNDRN
jgi:hypothetical protein